MTSKSVGIEVGSREAAKFQGFLLAFATAAEKASQRIARDQAEIDSLKLETRKILAELKALRTSVSLARRISAVPSGLTGLSTSATRR